MYTPPSFFEEELATLHAYIEENSFATLVTTGSSGSSVSHLSLLIDRDVGPRHTYRAPGKSLFTLERYGGSGCPGHFSGPAHLHLAQLVQERNFVPTWNYVAVHVTGKVQLVEEPSALLDIVRYYVDHYGSVMPGPWQLDSAEPHITESLLSAIVGFTIEIESIEGKWKVCQNHSEERRQ